MDGWIGVLDELTDGCWMWEWGVVGSREIVM